MVRVVIKNNKILGVKLVEKGYTISVKNNYFDWLTIKSLVHLFIWVYTAVGKYQGPGESGGGGLRKR